MLMGFCLITVNAVFNAVFMKKINVHFSSLRSYYSREKILPIPLTQYINAYAKCCNAKASLNCTKSDNEWFRRLLRKSTIVSQGNATLYWAHMRKTGGTSLGGSIESSVFNHTEEPRAMFTQGFGRTVKMHL